MQIKQVICLRYLSDNFALVRLGKFVSLRLNYFFGSGVKFGRLAFYLYVKILRNVEIQIIYSNSSVHYSIAISLSFLKVNKQFIKHYSPNKAL